MTWQLAALMGFAALFAASLLISISAMLALKIGDAIARAWRWCWGRA